MVTAAVLGAVVGTALALVITLSLLIYRYHARKYDDWSTWERRGPLYKTNTYESRGSRSRNPYGIQKPTYLPLVHQASHFMKHGSIISFVSIILLKVAFTLPLFLRFCVNLSIPTEYAVTQLSRKTGEVQSVCFDIFSLFFPHVGFQPIKKK